MKFPIYVAAIMTMVISNDAFLPLSVVPRGMFPRGYQIPVQMSLNEEQSNSPQNMAEMAEQMKRMTTEDLDDMINQVNSMPEAQRLQLKSMGMDPDMMLQSMKVMRDNPGVRESAQKMMEKMSPEELLEQSRLSQEQMKNMSKEQLESAARVVNSMSAEQIDEAASNLATGFTNEVVDAVVEKKSSSSPEDKKEVPFEGSAQDPAVIGT